PAAPEPGQIGKAYGYGLEVDSSHADPLIQHGGVILGYTSFVIMAPEYKTGVAVMCNQSGSHSDTVAQKLLARLMPASLGVGDQPHPPTGGDLSKYVGNYVNGASSIRIAMEDGKLTGQRPKSKPVQLTPSHDECFRGGSIAVCFTDGYAHLGLRAFRKQ
ncbi:MAG TPA: serine hydrolase, partial [Bryobacteraceae bacterium]|nr:serine hydrolase [Bryobacteraceae bacterium]